MTERPSPEPQTRPRQDDQLAACARQLIRAQLADDPVAIWQERQLFSLRLLWLLKGTLKGDQEWDKGRRWLDRLNLIALSFTDPAACLAWGYVIWGLSKDVGGTQWVTPVAFDLRFLEEFKELKEAVIRFDEAEPMPDEPFKESVRRIKGQIEEKSVQWLREFRYQAAVDGAAR